MRRPKFAARGKSVILDGDNNPKPELRALGTDAVIIEKSDIVGATARGIGTVTKMVFALISILLVLYLSLAATLMVVAPGATGLTWVVRGTFVGGVADTGDFTYASGSSTVEHGLGHNLIQAFVGVDDSLVAEIIAPPFSTVTLGDEGELLVDGEASGYHEDIGQKSLTLGEEYLAVCIVGSCDPGDVILLNQGNVAGEARGGVSFEGIGAYPSVRTNG